MNTIRVGNKGAAAVRANLTLMGHNIFAHQELHGDQHGTFTEDSAYAAKRMRWWLGYPSTQQGLTYDSVLDAYLHGQRKRTPLMVVRAKQRHGGKPVSPKKFIFPIPPAYRWKTIGWPYEGTHGVAFNKVSGTDNWESERAIDLGCAMGTPLVATAHGTIGPQFGPLNSHDPRMLGIRLHLVTTDDEFYYAHLSNTVAGLKPGSNVTQGQLLGHSGEANGVAHLHLAQKNGNPAQIFLL